MRLCVSAALVLLLGLTWTKAEPSPSPATEECSKLPLITDITQVLGQFYFHAGIADHKLFKALLTKTKNVWGNLTKIENGLRIVHYTTVNGTCFEAESNLTFSEGMDRIEMHGLREDFQLFSLSNSSVILEVKLSVSNYTRFRQIFPTNPKLDPKEETDQNPGQDHGDDSHVLSGKRHYLFGRDRVLSETDLQHFLAHAKCAGFIGEPDFTAKSEQGYCTKEESTVFSGKE